MKVLDKIVNPEYIDQTGLVTAIQLIGTDFEENNCYRGCGWGWLFVSAKGEPYGGSYDYDDGPEAAGEIEEHVNGGHKIRVMFSCWQACLG